LAAGIFPCRPHTPYYAVNRVKLNHKYAVQITKLLKTADPALCCTLIMAENTQYPGFTRYAQKLSQFFRNHDSIYPS